MGNFRGNNGGMQNMMKQAQKIQEQMQKAEAELDEMEVLGFSGGGEEGDETVVVYMNGKKVINGIEFGSKISEMVDLSGKADAAYEEKMGPLGGMSGLNGLL